MTKCYKSKWIISGDGNLFEDSVMVVEEGKIQGIYKESEFDKSSYKHFRDYGNSVITPGFINLHNHLQYTDIKKVTPKGLKAILKRLFSKLKKKYYLGDVRKNSFVYKIGELLSEYFIMSRAEKQSSFASGMVQSVLAGTTTLVQLSKETKYFEILNKFPVKTYLFFELFSDSRESSKEEFRTIQKKIDKFLKNKSENTYIGLAPHSICSVHKRLFKILAKYCKKNNLLMTLRIGESQEEMDWLRHGFSDIDVLNAYTGLSKFEPYMKGISPVEYLLGLGVINKRLIASHCEFLSEDDLKLLCENNVSLAYCPRSNELVHGKTLSIETVMKYFKNNFGFGTNSLAFNNSLNLLDEVNAVNNGNLDTLEAIKYLTLVPAKILRIDNITGSLNTGKDADFCVFPLADGEDYNAVMNSKNPAFVYIKGKKIVECGELHHKFE